MQELTEWNKECTDKALDIVDMTALEAKEAVSAAASGAGIGGQGAYKAGFYLKKMYSGANGKRYVLANKVYQLTHLLEFGHALWQGGRTRAFPHWQAAESIAQQLPERLKDAIN